MGLYHRCEPQAKASRLNGKSERFMSYILICGLLYIVLGCYRNLCFKITLIR